MEYIAGRSFLFFFLNKSLDLNFFFAIADLIILFLIQSLLFSVVSCNTKLAHCLWHVNYFNLHHFLLTWIWAIYEATTSLVNQTSRMKFKIKHQIIHLTWFSLTLFLTVGKTQFLETCCRTTKRHICSVKCSTNVKLFQDIFITDIILFSHCNSWTKGGVLWSLALLIYVFLEQKCLSFN